MTVLGRWLALVFVSAVLAAACGGGGETTPTATPTSSPATPSPTAASQVPERPANFNDYALAVASYLSDDPSAADTCLDALFDAWDMPLVEPASACERGNADTDPEDELVAMLTAESDNPTAFSAVDFRVVIFDPDSTGYAVAYESPVTPAAPPGIDAPETPPDGQSIHPILAIGDLFGSGNGGVAYETRACGAHTCSTSVHVLRGTDSGLDIVTPAEGITLESGDASIQDTDGDGVREIVLTGGQIGSVGAGPQREVTQTWAWNGNAYALQSTEQAPPQFLYHAVKDADALFDEGQYIETRDAYVAAAEDPTLRAWMPDRNERAELESYALFRAGLAELLAQGDVAAANGYFDRAQAYTMTLHTQLGGSFQAAYAAKGEISAGCAAVRDDIFLNLAEYQAFWDFGYANPEFDPDSVCPF